MQNFPRRADPCFALLVAFLYLGNTKLEGQWVENIQCHAWPAAEPVGSIFSSSTQLFDPGELSSPLWSLISSSRRKLMTVYRISKACSKTWASHFQTQHESVCGGQVSMRRLRVGSLSTILTRGWHTFSFLFLVWNPSHVDHGLYEHLC